MVFKSFVLFMIFALSQPAVAANTCLHLFSTPGAQAFAIYEESFQAPRQTNVPTLTSLLENLPDGATYFKADQVQLDIPAPQNKNRLDLDFAQLELSQADIAVLRNNALLLTDAQKLTDSANLFETLNGFADVLAVKGQALIRFDESKFRFTLLQGNGPGYRRAQLRDLVWLIPTITGGRLKVLEPTGASDYRNISGTTILWLEKVNAEIRTQPYDPFVWRDFIQNGSSVIRDWGVRLP